MLMVCAELNISYSLGHLYILAFNLKGLAYRTTTAFMLFLDISLGLVDQEANL